MVLLGRGVFRTLSNTYEMCCTISYYLYNLKIVKNTHRRVLLYVKMQVKPDNFSESNTSPWVFIAFFKLYKWYQIAQNISYYTAHFKNSSIINVWQSLKHVSGLLLNRSSPDVYLWTGVLKIPSKVAAYFQNTFL